MKYIYILIFIFTINGLADDYISIDLSENKRDLSNEIYLKLKKDHYLKNKDTMSSEEYAKTLIPTMRSWSETVFKNALIDRSENEINEIVDKFYDLYIEEVSNDPEGHSMDYVHVIMDIEKIS